MVNQMRKFKVDGTTGESRACEKFQQHTSGRLSIAGRQNYAFCSSYAELTKLLRKTDCHCVLSRTFQSIPPTDDHPINSDLVKGRLYLFKLSQWPKLPKVRGQDVEADKVPEKMPPSNPGVRFCARVD